MLDNDPSTLHSRCESYLSHDSQGNPSQSLDTVVHEVRTHRRRISVELKEQVVVGVRHGSAHL